jgi:hypothetical protein
MTEDTTHAVESALKGYVMIGHSRYGDRTGIGFGMYSRQSPESIREHCPGSTVTNVKRARYIARELHNWDMPSEDEILDQHLEGQAP